MLEEGIKEKIRYLTIDIGFFDFKLNTIGRTLIISKEM